MSATNCGCSEYLALSRRQFMATTGGVALAASLPEWMPRVAYADDACTDRDVLVAIFLVGGMDGLTSCVPHGDDAYYAARPTLAIPRPDSGSPHRAIDLDGYFGFPQPMAPLLPAYQAGHLLPIHASGSPDPTASHFDAMHYMEVGKPGDNNLFVGWLSRHLLSVPPLLPASVLRAIAVSFALPQKLAGAPDSLAIPDLANHDIVGLLSTRTARRALLDAMYDRTTDPLKATANASQFTIDMLHAIDFANYQPGGGAAYPDDAFGYALKTTAALIKADIGVEAVAVPLGGWDHHVDMRPFDGQMFSKLTTLAGGLAAFHADIFAGNGRNVTVIVQSEFGRRIAENASRGLDHGHGNCMFVMGNHIAGGRVLRNWPGLAPGQLYEGRDLDVTIDYRDVLAEIIQQRLANQNIDYIFPGYTPTIRGVTQSCVPGFRGDMNCDGALDASDVAPFAQALVDPDGFRGKGAGCDVMKGDLNGDGRVDGRDVAEFTRRIIQP